MKRTHRHTKPFRVSAIVWHEVLEHLGIHNLNAVEDALNTHIALQNYGTGVAHIVFIYIAHLPEDVIHEEKMEYNRKKKEIFIQAKLAYERLNSASEQEVPSMLAAAWVASVLRFSGLGIPDFQDKALYKDVKKLFEKQGWLKAQEA
jgi:hypothetical protein